SGLCLQLESPRFPPPSPSRAGRFDGRFPLPRLPRPPSPPRAGRFDTRLPPPMFELRLKLLLLLMLMSLLLQPQPQPQPPLQKATIIMPKPNEIANPAA